MEALVKGFAARSTGTSSAKWNGKQEKKKNPETKSVLPPRNPGNPGKERKGKRVTIFRACDVVEEHVLQPLHIAEPLHQEHGGHEVIVVRVPLHSLQEEFPLLLLPTL